MITSRRQFLTGLASSIAAPAVVKYANLMPVRGVVTDWHELQTPVCFLNGTPIYKDLVDITRRAFVPRLHVYLYQDRIFLEQSGRAHDDTFLGQA